MMPVELPAEARCVQCGFGLRADHEGWCPRCARGFDPADPTSYRLEKPTADSLLPALSDADARHVENAVIMLGLLGAFVLTPISILNAWWSGFVFVNLLVAIAARVTLSGWRTMCTLGIMFLVPGVVALAFVARSTYWDFGRPGRAVGFMLSWLVLLVMAGGTLELLPRWRARRAREERRREGDPAVFPRRRRRVVGAVLLLFWLNVMWPAIPRMVTFWVSAPFLSHRADAAIATGRGERRVQFVGGFLVYGVILQPRGTVEFWLTPNDAPIYGIMFVPPGQDLGQPYRSTRIWPLRNWRFFSF